MERSAFLNTIKTILFFVMLCLFSAAFAQNNQSNSIAQTSPIALDERSHADSHNNSSKTAPSTSSEGTFALGKGYLIEVPTDHPNIPTPFKGSFSGVPNNGTMNIDLKAGFNLVGNPYPSGINVYDFIDSNPSITGTVYFLKKNNPKSKATSYATLTKTAYVTNGAKEDDLFIGYFEAGNESNWFINMAQGFFVNATIDSRLIFTNSMRRITTVDPDFENSQAGSTKKGLYWLNLKNDAGAYSQMAVGYSPEGTLAEDKGIDGRNINLDFYLTSVVDDVDYAIQGRPEFAPVDIVPLSFKVPESGDYTIAIDHTIGVFQYPSQTIYIKDKLKHTLHDLNHGAYSFYAQAGSFADRFEIVYKADK